MLTIRCTGVLAIVVIGTTIGCSSSSSLPAPTTINHAAIAIVGLSATVEPLTTTPQPGLLYKLTYQLRESGGLTGATAVAQHFAFSNGASADGNFNTAVTPPHVAAGSAITIVSTYSVFPASTPAGHVVFTVSFTDDAGQSGTASTEADISRVGL
jgi:hypothetical protein